MVPSAVSTNTFANSYRDGGAEARFSMNVPSAFLPTRFGAPARLKRALFLLFDDEFLRGVPQHAPKGPG